jgi:GR25 family glycosyltransferase involved in LPS biosynthesis
MDTYLDKICGKGTWAAYCISLKRCVERRSNFTKWAESIGLTFEFFDAIDKLSLTASDIDATDGISFILFMVYLLSFLTGLHL